MKRRRPAPRKPEVDGKDLGAFDLADQSDRSSSLSAEEGALWRHVTSSVETIARKPRVRSNPLNDDDGDIAAAPGRRPAAGAAGAVTRNEKSRAKSPGSLRRPETKSAPALAEFDPRKARKLAAGRAPVDARLDLHGLRQDEALNRLRRFLRDCYARGLKTVLVITGKGRGLDDSGAAHLDTLDREPRGVLRRNLPRWLDEPALRAIVVSYTTAAQRHGGDGAFYVELRRERPVS